MKRSYDYSLDFNKLKQMSVADLKVQKVKLAQHTMQVDKLIRILSLDMCLLTSEQNAIDAIINDKEYQTKRSKPFSFGTGFDFTGPSVNDFFNNVVTSSATNSTNSTTKSTTNSTTNSTEPEVSVTFTGIH